MENSTAGSLKRGERLLQAAGAAAMRQQQLSEAFSYASLAPLASVFCPVAPPLAAPQLLQQRLQTAFGASGAVAAAVDSATLPWRLRQPPPLGSLGRPTGAVQGAPALQAFGR